MPLLWDTLCWNLLRHCHGRTWWVRDSWKTSCGTDTLESRKTVLEENLVKLKDLVPWKRRKSTCPMWGTSLENRPWPTCASYVKWQVVGIENHQRNRVPSTAHPLHKSTFRTVSALRLRCPAFPVWSPSMYKTHYVHSTAPAVQTGSQPNPSLLPCKPKHILRGSTAKRNVFPQTNSCEFSASDQGRNKRPASFQLCASLK